MKKTSDAANQLTPFFLENGFFRKGNRFIKFENCFLYEINFHHGYALAPEFQVIPFYYPYYMRSIPFGSRFGEYKNHRLHYQDYCQVDERAIPYMVNKNEKSMDFDKWIHDTEDFCETHIFPLMSKVSSLCKMRSFLEKGLYVAHGEWSNLTPVAYYELKAYTYFVLEEYDKMQVEVKSGVRAIDSFGTSDSIKNSWKSNLEVLDTKKELSRQDKSKWLNDIVSNTLRIWLGKNWEAGMKNRLVLPIDFRNC